ncbi:hypothetical protein F5H01DRAFT_393140 [Linnemannia elongata]|nr:hypothetical protein F5H01DRAFT_393140 [Linnemannia elongata]
MIVAYPTKWSSQLPALSDLPKDTSGVQQVVINVSDNNFGKIFPKEHVEFIDRLKNSLAISRASPIIWTDKCTPAVCCTTSTPVVSPKPVLSAFVASEPHSALTTSSASSSSLFHSSLPSASTLHTIGSTAVKSGSWGPATGAGVVNSGSGGPYISNSTHMSLATPSSSTITAFSPHSLRRFASRDALHRSTSSPSQNQGFRRSTSGCSEGLTYASAMASVGGGAAQTKAEEKPLSNPTQVVDMMDGQQDEFQFTESPLPYTPQGQTPPTSGSKAMDSRTSIDSLGGRPSSSTTTTTAVPTAFPPGIGNLNRPSMDYMSFKPATSSSSSSARDSLLQQQRYDPGLSSAGRARGQSVDMRRGRRVDADPDDGDDETVIITTTTITNTTTMDTPTTANTITIIIIIITITTLIRSSINRTLERTDDPVLVLSLSRASPPQPSTTLVRLRLFPTIFYNMDVIETLAGMDEQEGFVC